MFALVLLTPIKLTGTICSSPVSMMSLLKLQLNLVARTLYALKMLELKL